MSESDAEFLECIAGYEAMKPLSERLRKIAARLEADDGALMILKRTFRKNRVLLIEQRRDGGYSVDLGDGHDCVSQLYAKDVAGCMEELRKEYPDD